MTKGRKALPNAVKRLKGTDQKCRMRKEEPLVNPMALTDFDVINIEGLKSERQKRIFQMAAKRLAALNLMDESFQDALILYSYWLDVAFTAMSKIDGDKMIVSRYDDNGRVAGFIINPYIGLLDKATKQVNDIGRQFGFTAISRQNIKMAEKELNPVEAIELAMK